MAGLRQKKVGAWGVGSGMFWVFGVAPAKGDVINLSDSIRSIRRLDCRGTSPLSPS